MKAYEIYYDRSDEYEQHYETLGYYLHCDKGLEDLKGIIKEREKDDPFVEDVDLWDGKDEYMFYGIQEIEVNTERKGQS